MKHLLALTLVCILTLTGCATLKENEAAIAPVTTSVASMTLALTKNPEQRTKIANALYAGATALRTLDPAHPPTTAQFEQAARTFFPKGSTEDVERYSQLATSLASIYGAALVPRFSKDVRDNLVLIEEFAAALENAAKPWVR